MKKLILGVRIDDVTIDEAATLKRGLIFTPNPEFLVEAYRNPDFKKLLNCSDLNIPDGVGLQIFGGVKNRVPGIDLMLRLCAEAARNNYSVGLFGGVEGVAQKCATVLKRKFPGLKIKFAIDGVEADRIMTTNSELPATDFLFVALGMVKQEQFLFQISSANRADQIFKVGMGVGGSFDEIIGKRKPAPKLVRIVGFEWLWRLFWEPRRIKRIFNAVILFLALLLKEKYV